MMNNDNKKPPKRRGFLAVALGKDKDDGGLSETIEATRKLLDRLDEINGPKAEERAVQQATEQATERATQPATEGATERATQRATEGTTERATQRTTEGATERAPEGATQRAGETVGAPRGAPGRAPEGATQRTTEGTTERATQRTTEGATERATQRTTERTTERATQRAPEGATQRATPPEGQVVYFNEKEALVYEVLRLIRGHFTSRILLAKLPVSYSQIRRILRRLIADDFVSEEKHRVAGRDVAVFWVKDVAYRCPNPKWVGTQIRKMELTSFVYGEMSDSASPKIDRLSCIENLSIPVRGHGGNESVDGESHTGPKVLCSDVGELWDSDCYPHLAALGFGAQKLQQVQIAWQKLGLDLQALPEALDRAEWMAGPGRLPDVRNPLSCIVQSLKNGMPSPPAGYRSRRQILADAMHQRAEEIRRLEQQYFEDAFTVWWHELDEAERRRIDASNKVDALNDAYRRKYFKENVFKPLN